MEREIEFKAWDDKLKKMFDGDEIEESETIKTYLSYGRLTIGCFPKNGDYYELKPLQFTGLTDKNGKRVFEGDELMYIGTNMSSMIVEFKDGCFVGVGPFNTLPLKDYLNADDFVSIEIIGNIFD